MTAYAWTVKRNQQSPAQPIECMSPSCLGWVTYSNDITPNQLDRLSSSVDFDWCKHEQKVLPLFRHIIKIRSLPLPLHRASSVLLTNQITDGVTREYFSDVCTLLKIPCIGRFVPAKKHKASLYKLCAHAEFFIASRGASYSTLDTLFLLV